MSAPAAARETIPAGAGRAFRLGAGRTIRVINTTGTQVVDTWAFVAADAGEYLSMEHCREVLQKLCFEPADRLVTNRYRPILEIAADTSGGGHDSLIAACSGAMYEHAGAGGGHASCADNLARALAPLGLEVAFTPAPWNLFMRAPVSADGRIDYIRPTSPPGGFVELTLLADAVLAFSACPDDVYPTNGGDGSPSDAHLMLL